MRITYDDNQLFGDAFDAGWDLDDLCEQILQFGDKEVFKGVTELKLTEVYDDGSIALDCDRPERHLLGYPNGELDTIMVYDEYHKRCVMALPPRNEFKKLRTLDASKADDYKGSGWDTDNITLSFETDHRYDKIFEGDDTLIVCGVIDSDMYLIGKQTHKKYHVFENGDIDSYDRDGEPLGTMILHQHGWTRMNDADYLLDYKTNTFTKKVRQ